MSALLDNLRGRGCNIDDALVRFSNNEGVYTKLYKNFVREAAFEELGAALAGKNADEAFRHAHALKEVAANMGIRSLQDIMEKMVKPLRAGNCGDDLNALYQELMKELRIYRILASRDGA